MDSLVLFFSLSESCPPVLALPSIFSDAMREVLVIISLPTPLVPEGTGGRPSSAIGSVSFAT